VDEMRDYDRSISGERLLSLFRKRRDENCRAYDVAFRTR